MAMIGRYELRGTLGAGGFATVYLAWDTVLRREVALKTLLPQAAEHSAVRERFIAELQLFSGRRIEPPSMFIAGASDWGIHQSPGALERMQKSACADMRGCHLIPGAGHWVQQEQPAAVGRLLLEFLGDLPARA